MPLGETAPSRWSSAVEHVHGRSRSTRTEVAPLTAGTGEMPGADPGFLHAVRNDAQTA